MATVVKDLGAVTAYAYAVAGGYSGTEAEFEALLGNIAEDLSEIENLSVTVTTLPAGSSATASYSNGVLSLGIPKGDKGDTGATPNFSIGTVTTGAAGSSASATITGTDEAPVLNLTIPRGDTGEVNAMSIAQEYSSSATYAVGDYVFYNGALYRCITAITTAEAWTAAHWTAAVLGDDVSDLKSALTNVEGELTYDGTLGVENYNVNTLNAAGGGEQTSTTRLCSRYLSADSIKFVKPTSGYKVMVYAYTKAFSYIGIWNGSSFVKQTANDNWTTTGRDISVLPQNYLYRILLAKSNDATISKSDCDNAIFTFTADGYQGATIPITYDAESDDKSINASGEIISYTGYHYTNLLPVITDVCYRFTFNFFSSTKYIIRIHGYDASGVWVKEIIGDDFNMDADILFAVADQTVKYIRIAMSKQVLDAKLFPESSIADAVNYKVYTDDFDAIKYGIAKGTVDLTTSNAICKCIESYLKHNSDFVYEGFSGTPVRLYDDGVVDSGTGKLRIDCSTFALLVLMGVDFDNSRYNQSNTTNKIGSCGYGFNPFWGDTAPWSIPHDATGTYTWMMCRDYAKLGCTVDIVNRDFSGALPGDLIFWGSSSKSNTDGRYKRIRHVDVVIGRVGEKDVLVADAGDVPITVHLASERTADDDIAVLARLPLGPSPKNTLNTICEDHGTAISTKTYSVNNITKYTPVAVKFKVTQTESSGVIEIVDSANKTVFESDTMNAGTQGKTLEVIGRGFVQSAGITSLTVNATGCEILATRINYPATCIEDDIVS